MITTKRRLFAPALLLCALAAPLASTAEAKGAASRCLGPRPVNARQNRQERRIEGGIKSGELTRREAGRLAAEQAHLAVLEARARQSGGEFTTRERARLQRELNQSSRHIYRQKHDAPDRN